jgi:hypothetical protein
MTEDEFNKWGKLPPDIDEYVSSLEENQNEESTPENIENLFNAIRSRFTNLGPQSHRGIPWGRSCLFI